MQRLNVIGGSLAGLGLLAFVGLAGLPERGISVAAAQNSDFPPLEKVVEGLKKVTSTADGSDGYWDLYEDRQKGRVMAVLPRNYEGRLMMIACTENLAYTTTKEGMQCLEFVVRAPVMPDSLAPLFPSPSSHSS